MNNKTVASMTYEDYTSLIRTKDEGAKYVVSLRCDENLNYFLDVSNIDDLKVEKIGNNVSIRDINDDKVFKNPENISPMGRPIVLDGNFKDIHYNTHINYGEISNNNGIFCTEAGGNQQKLALNETEIKKILEDKGMDSSKIYENQKEKAIDLSKPTMSEDDLNTVLRASFINEGKYVLGIRVSDQRIYDNLNGVNKKSQNPYSLDIISMDDLEYKKINRGAVIYGSSDNAVLNPNMKFSGLYCPVVLDSNFNILENCSNNSISKNSDGSFSFESVYGVDTISIENLKNRLEIRESLQEKTNKIELAID